MARARLPDDLHALSVVRVGPETTRGRLAALLLLPLLGLVLYGSAFGAAFIECAPSNNPGDTQDYTSGAYGRSGTAFCRPLGESDTASMVAHVVGAGGVLVSLLWLDPGNGHPSAPLWTRRLTQATLAAAAMVAPLQGWDLVGVLALAAAWLVAASAGLRAPDARAARDEAA